MMHKLNNIEEIKMESKYLSDGRKVCVIGKINTSEHIVQEIFITENGDEIPSGEKFTTKSLHDAPVESYKQRSEKELEKRVAAASRELELVNLRLAEANKKARANLAIASSALKSIGCIKDKEKLNLLSMFLSGSIEYVVFDNYSILPPLKFEDAVQDGSYNELKLISLFGKANGDLEFRINQYRDGSGSDKTITAFETYQQALNHIKLIFMSKIENNRGYCSDFKKCLDMGIVFTGEEKAKIKNLFLTKRTEEAESAVKSHERSIERINNLYDVID